MNKITVIHSWNKQDKWLYWLSLIPFLVGFIGSVMVLSSYSTWLGISLLFFYFLINVFQAVAVWASHIGENIARQFLGSI